MEKPFLTPDNVMLSKHQVDTDSWGYNSCLELHMQINSYIEFLCDNSSFDGGGKYASWLNSLGFHHQTDEGWWNKTAVDLDNIELFVKWYKWDSDVDCKVCEAIQGRIDAFGEFKKIKGARVSLIEHHAKVANYLDLQEEI